MPIRCRNCGSDDLRLSHFRIADIWYCLALRYPIRCRNCRRRSTANLISLFRIRRQAKLRREPRAVRG
jgi:hypothetical protein